MVILDEFVKIHLILTCTDTLKFVDFQKWILGICRSSEVCSFGAVWEIFRDSFWKIFSLCGYLEYLWSGFKKSFFRGFCVWKN